MAKLDGPLFGEEATGSAAGVLFYRRTQPYPEIYSRPCRRAAASTNQAAHRLRYREACQAWDILSQSEKDQYNNSIVDLHSGFNLFMRLWFQVYHSLFDAVVFGTAIFDEDPQFHIPDQALFVASFPDAVDSVPVLAGLYDNFSAFVFNFLGSRLVAVEQYLIDHKSTIEQG